MIGLRVTLIGLGAVLGVVALLNGFAVIGVILLVMAALRGAMLFRIAQRRGRRRVRREELMTRFRERHGATDRW